MLARLASGRYVRATTHGRTQQQAAAVLRAATLESLVVFRLTNTTGNKEPTHSECRRSGRCARLTGRGSREQAGVSAYTLCLSVTEVVQSDLRISSEGVNFLWLHPAVSRESKEGGVGGSQ